MSNYRGARKQGKRTFSWLRTGVWFQYDRDSLIVEGTLIRCHFPLKLSIFYTLGSKAPRRAEEFDVEKVQYLIVDKAFIMMQIIPKIRCHRILCEAYEGRGGFKIIRGKIIEAIAEVQRKKLGTEVYQYEWHFAP